jgi:hypothetical protein
VLLRFKINVAERSAIFVFGVKAKTPSFFYSSTELNSFAVKCTDTDMQDVPFYLSFISIYLKRFVFQFICITRLLL